MLFHWYGEPNKNYFFFTLLNQWGATLGFQNWKMCQIAEKKHSVAMNATKKTMKAEKAIFIWYHGTDMQNVTFLTQAHFQTKIFSWEKYLQSLINTSFMYSVKTYLMSSYPFATIYNSNWCTFLLFYPEFTNFTKKIMYKRQNMENFTTALVIFCMSAVADII